MASPLPSLRFTNCRFRKCLDGAAGARILAKRSHFERASHPERRLRLSASLALLHSRIDAAVATATVNLSLPQDRADLKIIAQSLGFRVPRSTALTLSA